MGSDSRSAPPLATTELRSGAGQNGSRSELLQAHISSALHPDSSILERSKHSAEVCASRLLKQTGLGVPRTRIELSNDQSALRRTVEPNFTGVHHPRVDSTSTVSVAPVRNGELLEMHLSIWHHNILVCATF